jgi:hypothetical protein
MAETIEAVVAPTSNPVTEATTVAEVPKRTKQALTAEEREPLHKFETAYLKAQIQLNALTQQTQAAQKGFTEAVEALGKKYEINPKEMQFDNTQFEFVAIAGQAAPVAMKAVKQ